MTEHYFLYPFGVSGTLASVPNPTQVSGTVSYQSGFPIGYQLANTAPGYLSIPRDQFNQIMFDVTGALQQLQQTGFPSWITSAANGGTSFSYALGAEVWYLGVPYRSLIAGNTDTPPTSNWSVIGANRSLYFNFATDTGSANVYVVAPDPAIAALAAGQVVQMQPAFANTGACTLNVNGLGAKPIKTLQNQDPTAGMIIPSGMFQFEYNAVTSAWVIQNPALGTAAYQNTGTATGNVIQWGGADAYPAGVGSLITGIISGTAGATGKLVIPAVGITIQWAIQTGGVNSGAGTAVTYGTAFSATPYFVTTSAIITSNPANFTTGTELVPAVRSVTSTGFTAYPGGTAWSGSFYYLAIGPT